MSSDLQPPEIRMLGISKLWGTVCVDWLQVKKKKKRVTWSRYRPSVAQRVGRGMVLLFHDRGSRRGWVVSSTPLPHFTPRKDLVRILQEAGCAPGLVWMGGKSRRHQDFFFFRTFYDLIYVTPQITTAFVQNKNEFLLLGWNVSERQFLKSG